MSLYNKATLDIVANEYGFIRDNLEKVVRLAEILRHFTRDAELSQSFALKGGTAINLCVFQMPRLSVDIDLDFCADCGRDEMLMKRKSANDAILRYMKAEGYRLSPMTKNPHALDSWVFSYTNAGGNNDVIKIEINYSNRCHILPVKRQHVVIPFLRDAEVVTLAPIELFASKITALICRCAARDLYDTHKMITCGLFNSQEEKALLRKSVTFYLTVGSGRDIIRDFDSFPLIDNIRYPQIRAQLMPVLKKSEHFDFETAKLQVTAFLSDLMQLTDREKMYMSLFENGCYTPELLFDDEDIVERVRHHPMALWKTREKETDDSIEEARPRYRRR